MKAISLSIVPLTRYSAYECHLVKLRMSGMIFLFWYSKGRSFIYTSLGICVNGAQRGYKLFRQIYSSLFAKGCVCYVLPHRFACFHIQQLPVGQDYIFSEDIGSVEELSDIHIKSFKHMARVFECGRNTASLSAFEPLILA